MHTWRTTSSSTVPARWGSALLTNTIGRHQQSYPNIKLAWFPRARGTMHMSQPARPTPPYVGIPMHSRKCSVIQTNHYCHYYYYYHHVTRISHGQNTRVAMLFTSTLLFCCCYARPSHDMARSTPHPTYRTIRLHYHATSPNGASVTADLQAVSTQQPKPHPYRTSN